MHQSTVEGGAGSDLQLPSGLVTKAKQVHMLWGNGAIAIEFSSHIEFFYSALDRPCL
jgi:hypothetical protein